MHEDEGLDGAVADAPFLLGKAAAFWQDLAQPLPNSSRALAGTREGRLGVAHAQSRVGCHLSHQAQTNLYGGVPRWEPVRGWEKVAAGLSMLAGALHLIAGPEHVEQWWAYGLFFFAAAAFQVAYGLALATQGIEAWGGWDQVRGRVYIGGIAATLAILGLWLASRTVGVPVGPLAFQPEGVGVFDATSKLVEATLILVLARLAFRTDPMKRQA